MRASKTRRPKRGSRSSSRETFWTSLRRPDGIRKRLHPNDIVTYIVDRNINYTNVCWVACSFCAFYRTKRQAEKGRRLRFERRSSLAEDTGDRGPRRNRRLDAGACTRTWGWVHDGPVPRHPQRVPRVQVHALSPAEIWHLVDKSGLSLEDTLKELKKAGLMSIPGGGARSSPTRRGAVSPRRTRRARGWT